MKLISTLLILLLPTILSARSLEGEYRTIERVIESIDGLGIKPGLRYSSGPIQEIGRTSVYGHIERSITETAKERFFLVFFDQLKKEIKKNGWRDLTFPEMLIGETVSHSFFVTAESEKDGIDFVFTVFFPEDDTIRISFVQTIKEK